MNNQTKNKNLHLIYDFGLMPHVNNYKLKDDKGSVPKYPLRLMYCDDSKLLRLDSMPDRENIYRDYDHLSSASSANAKHLESIAENINNSESTGKIILEVGCNDATLLRGLNTNFNIFGIDPASNVYRHEEKDQFKVIHEFFDKNNVLKIKNIIKKPVDIIIGINVFAHNDNYIEMFEAIYELLSDDGYAHIEVAYAAETIMAGNFDTIYHEHFCNYTLTSFKNIIDPIGLKIIDAEKISTQGGSLRVKISKKISNAGISKNVIDILDYELEHNYTDINFYKKLSDNIDAKINQIRKLFIDRNLDEEVLIVGVPARGVITANTCDFDKLSKAIAFDDTPEKQGKLIPGTNILINSPQEINFSKYKTACLLAWTYKENLLPRLKAYGFKGQIFIPFPSPRYENIKD